MFVRNIFQNPYFRLPQQIPAGALSSIVLTAFDLLSLNQKTSNRLSLLSDLFSVGSHTFKIIRTPSLLCEKREAMKTAFAVMKIATPFLNPKIGLALMPGIEAVHSAVLFFNEKNRENLGRFLLNSTYLALLLSGTPHLQLASLLFKAVISIYQAYDQYGKGYRVEALIKAICGLYRIYQSNPLLCDLYFDYFGKEITESEWRCFIEPLKEESSPLNVRSLLLKNRFCPRLSHLTFQDLHQYIFDRVSFSDCKFRGTISSSAFHHVQARSCNFDSSVFKMCSISQSQFFKCSFFDFFFIDSHLCSSSFQDSDFSSSLWFGSLIEETSFTASAFSEANFFKASVRKSVLKACRLTNALLCHTQDAFKIEGELPRMTKPVVCLPWSLKENGFWTRQICAALRINQAVVFRLPIELIDTAALDSQVKAAFPLISPSEVTLSIPEEMLRTASTDSPIDQVQKTVSRALKYCDGLSIPGNAYDVHPKFYGKPKKSETYCDAHYLKEIVEFAAIREAHKSGLPVMGTCRGAQLINIYFGGTLSQYVPDQMGKFFIMPLEDSPHSAELKELADSDVFHLLSMHRQAVAKKARNLDVLLQNEEGIAKLLISRDGKFIACQGHPENFCLDRQQLESQLNSYESLAKRIRQQVAIYQFFFKQIFLSMAERENPQTSVCI